jgi:hypothetical protein
MFFYKELKQESTIVYLERYSLNHMRRWSEAGNPGKILLIAVPGLLVYCNEEMRRDAVKRVHRKRKGNYGPAISVLCGDLVL